jgi:hypothetical protein
MLGKENLASVICYLLSVIIIINYNHTVTQLVHMINHTYICHVCMYLEGMYSCSMHSMYLGSMYVHVRLYQGTSTCGTRVHMYVHTHMCGTRSTYILHVLQLHIYIDVPLCSWLSLLLLLLLLLLAFATLTTITTFLLLFGTTSTSTSTSTLHGHVIHPLCELVFFNRP